MAESAVPATDLLLGMLAVQTGLISQGGLYAACEVFSRNRSPERPLAQTMVDLELVTRWQRGLLENLRAEHLARYDGDAEAALAAFVASRTAPPQPPPAGDLALMTTLGFPPARSEARLGYDLDATLPDVPNMAAADPLAGTVAGPPPDDDLSETPTLAATIGDPGNLVPRRRQPVSTPARAGADRFQVIKQHASGGLGVVYLARDAELNRDVALKRIKNSHADDPVSRQRFLLEAEVTGGLEHPGIVPVYGLGTSPDGRLYYAMRFIRGDSLADAIATFHTDVEYKTDPGARSLELRKLLRRFLDLCNTIEYAHGRGVLHRDIKPDNVMVGRYGETLVVDWGIAKVTGRSDPSRSGGERPLAPTSIGGETETLAGTAIGTPAFMSPEQAAGDVESLGPASDVYSLGATLYVILTGRPAFTGRELKTVLRAVREGTFPPPREVGRSVDRALEAVCLKAMALQPEMRYPSAQALADDVERWMADEPVTALPEPFRQRARRWARRNRTAVTSGAVAVAVAIVGLAVVLAVEARANRDLRAANGQIQARFALASRAIRTFYTGVSEDLLLRQSEFQTLRHNLLGSAREFYIELEKLLEGRPDRESRVALARTFYDLGELTSKIGAKPDALTAHGRALQLREALAAGPEATSESIADVGRSKLAIGLLERDLGRLDASEANLASGRELLERLAAKPAIDPEIEFDLAAGYYTLGRLQEDNGQSKAAMAAHERARDLRDRLVHAAPSNPSYRAKLAESLHELGFLYNVADRTAEALAVANQARKLREALVTLDPKSETYRHELAFSDSLLGDILKKTGATDEALKALARAVAERETLVGDAPTNTEFQNRLAQSNYHLAELRSQTGDVPGALKAYARARALWEALVKADPLVPTYQSDLVAVLVSSGSELASAGRTQDALRAFEEGRATLDAMVKAHPTVTRYQSNLALIHVRIANFLDETGRLADARQAYLHARALQAKLSAAEPNVTKLVSDLAWTDEALGDLLGRDARPVEGLAALERAREARARLVAAHPEVSDHRADLARTQSKTAVLLAEIGRPYAGTALILEARATFAALAEADPKNTELPTELAQTRAVEGTILAAAGRSAPALAAFMQARAAYSTFVDANPNFPAYRAGRAVCDDEAAELLTRAGRTEAALAALDRAHADWDALVKESPVVAEFQYGLLRNRRARADALALAGHSDTSTEVYAETRAKAEALVKRFPEMPAFAVESSLCDVGLGEFDRALATLHRLPRPRPAHLYILARVQARRAGRAAAVIASLRHAVDAGFRDSDALATEPAFESMRANAAFHLIALDAAFPDDPFGP
jgi:eukaryotic-like serine/threonine-protein kinase